MSADERELSAEERQEIDALLPQGWQLAGLDPHTGPAAGAVVRAVNDLVGQLRKDALSQERAAELALTLGCLLGQQWCREFGWEWRYVSIGTFQGYGVVPAGGRFVYFAMHDVHELLVSQTAELNLRLLFNLVAAGDLPPASDREYVSLG
jgi:hypothetical protein